MYPTVSKSPMRPADSSEADHLLDILRTPAGEMAVWSGMAAGNDARCDASNHAGRVMPRTWIVVDDVEATAANVDEPFDPWPSTYAVYQAARSRRAEAIALLIRDAASVLRDAIRNAWRRYRRRRETRGIYDALRGLDDRTLRDLGFHRCEIWSVAAEATGEAEHTRIGVRVLPYTPHHERA